MNQPNMSNVHTNRRLHGLQVYAHVITPDPITKYRINKRKKGNAQVCVCVNTYDGFMYL